MLKVKALVKFNKKKKNNPKPHTSCYCLGY